MGKYPKIVQIVKQVLLNNEKTKIFLFFLAISSLFWVITKFTKQFTQSIECNVKIVNTINDVIIENDVQTIHLAIKASGFSLFSYNIFGKTIDINLKSDYLNSSGQIIVPSIIIYQNVKRQFDPDVEILNTITLDLKFKYYKLSSKKVAIRVLQDIDLEKGYGVSDIIFLGKDSILVTGEKEKIDKIQFVTTQIPKNKNISQSFTQALKIDPSKLESLDYSPKKVEISFEIEKFTEQSFTLPLRLINKPKKVSVRLFPNEIKLTCYGSIEKLKNITAKDFEMVCDYKEIEEQKPNLTPILIHQPSNLKNLRWEPMKIDYLKKE